MKTLIVCDSGLGGLDIAAQFFAKSEPAEWDLIYFNAFPDAKIGYNDLADDRMKEDVFRNVLESMERYSPAMCLIACNTLSIIWQQLSRRWRPSFPVKGIVEAAVGLMTDAARKEPASHLLILGTKTTVESQVYPRALIENGIAPERLHSLSCHGLARRIEQNPASPEVASQIADSARQAAAMFRTPPEKLYLCFCCTHYGYAENCWLKEFGRYFPSVGILNPNRALSLPGGAAGFRYCSRMEMTDIQRESMSEWFAASAPAVADALRKAKTDKELFPLPDDLRLKP